MPAFNRLRLVVLLTGRGCWSSFCFYSCLFVHAVTYNCVLLFLLGFVALIPVRLVELKIQNLFSPIAHRAIKLQIMHWSFPNWSESAKLSYHTTFEKVYGEEEKRERERRKKEKKPANFAVILAILLSRALRIIVFTDQELAS